MKLVISALSKSTDARILLRFLAGHAKSLQHVQGVLVTPLMISSTTLIMSRTIQDEFGMPVLFDSGGYAVQTGRLDYFEMYSRLIETYRRERWADLYTLPDHVPTSQDADGDVNAKVRQTMECAKLFMRELPCELRERAMGVVHGRTRADLEFCLDGYMRLGLRHIGFGSFGTAGPDSGMNIATSNAVDNAKAICSLACQQGISVHLFGVGAPAILPWIARTGASSYDSANWARSAGFGQVFLPLTRGYNITHRSAKSSIQQGLTRTDFENLRAISGHACAYCESFDRLQSSREARAGHNLMATMDALDIIARADTRQMSAIYTAASPKYRRLWQRWTEDS